MQPAQHARVSNIGMKTTVQHWSQLLLRRTSVRCELVDAHNGSGFKRLGISSEPQPLSKGAIYGGSQAGSKPFRGRLANGKFLVIRIRTKRRERTT